MNVVATALGIVATVYFANWLQRKAFENENSIEHRLARGLGIDVGVANLLVRVVMFILVPFAVILVGLFLTDD